jgi:enamine deaminase RidA (YjgF/YER057c/UK114 family)
MSAVLQRLQELGVELPEAAKPAANYVSYVVSGNQITVSGQIPMVGGKLDGNVGRLGAEFDVEQGKEIAKICAINVIAQVKDACGGDLDNVRCLRLGVFVNATDDFKDHPAVANGASDLIANAFGERGKHARAAVGVGSLPFGVAVEIDATFEMVG